MICPRCLKNELHHDWLMNSISRRDNKTIICNICGTEESFIDYNPLYDAPGVDERESRIKSRHE